MSNLTRNTLAQSVLAAVRGKTNGRMEEDRPEDLEGDPAEEEATTEEDDTSAEGDPPEEDPEGDKPKEGEEEEGEEPKASASTKIRRAEQSRIKSILTHPRADANPGLAAELAFGTKFYSAEEAGALLASSAGGSRLADKMQGRTPQLGSGGGAGKSSERQAVVAGVGNVIKAMHGRNQKDA